MAVRLQMKLGVVAEHDRLVDSPDTLVVVEPTVGSVARSKGLLYLLVTSRLASRHGLEATRLAAETIRNEYYYDESAGIRVCLQKAIMTANKRLAHQADRLGLKTTDGNGPIGVAVAVVRGNEMYVATVGPAEAYLIRQARLSTLPDPQRDRGLPAGELEPDVWRGEVAVGDSLVLISPNVMSKLGVDELKDAMLTLHPQSAMEHLHHRFVAADGSGSDGAIAFEAAEVSATSKSRTLVPVKPAEPLAGAPDRSPIPLADNVAAAGGAVTAAAGSARAAAGSAMDRLVARLQDLMPRRKPAYRRVTPLATRRETQRRAAMAALALIIVVGGLGLAVYAFGGASPEKAISSVNAGQQALDAATADLAKVTGPGIDLVADDPGQAKDLLTHAYQQLDLADAAKVKPSVVLPLRTKVEAGLDRLYGVVPVASTTLFTFKPAEGADPIDLHALVRGPDGAPYVIDRSTRAVYRIDLKAKKATLVARYGQKANGSTVAAPRYLGVGGASDLLILDSKNVLWRWRPADATGKGTLVRINVEGSTSWGDDIRGFGTYLRDAERSLYNLYVVDPSEQQIRAYSPSADGGGFPGKSLPWLATARDVSAMTSIYIDGDLYAADNGKLIRFVGGKSEGWDAGAPDDLLLRTAPVYTIAQGGVDVVRRAGWIYAYDGPNARIVAVDKSDGTYKAQYRLAGGADGWDDMRAFYVVPGVADAPATLVWVTSDGLHQAVLVVVPDIAPLPSSSPGASASPAVSAKPTKPTKSP
jgi:hypothetical protein